MTHVPAVQVTTICTCHGTNDFMLGHLDTSNNLSLIDHMQTILPACAVFTTIRNDKAIGGLVMQNPPWRLRKSISAK